MTANFQTLKRLAGAAAKWRKENRFADTHGHVLFYRGDVAGWVSALDEPHKWCPGCVAVGVRGLDEPIYLATGGNDDAGAKEWSVIWNPVLELEQLAAFLHARHPHRHTEADVFPQDI